MNRGPLESVRVSVSQGNQVQKYQARDLPAVQGLGVWNIFLESTWHVHDQAHGIER